MPSPENYEAIITLSPPNTDEKIKIELKLFPSDIIETHAGAKSLRNCTLDELSIYANQLEADVGDAYRRMTIAELLLDKQSEMAVNTSAEAWLDKVVVIDEAATADSDKADATSETVAPAPVAEPEPPLDVEEIAVLDDSAEFPTPPQEPDPADIAEISIVEATAPPINPLDSITILKTESVVEDREVVGEFKVSADDRTGGDISAESRHNLKSSVHILLDEKPLRKMQAHASSSMRREVAGVMVGPIPEKQPDGRYVVHVTDMIIAKHTKMSGASVTYTPESWRQLNDDLFGRYPNETHVMVGWYHTHPGFGIFLSNMDLFIHTNFFTQVWHTAYVLDPVGQTSGFFSWDKEQTRVMPYDFAWPEWAPQSW